MRRLLRFALVFALAPATASLVGCREPTSPEGETPEAGGPVEVEEQQVTLPDPLPLPAEPRAASWIAQPAAAVALVAPYSPMEIDLHLGVEQALGGVTEATLAAELARAVDLDAPFSNVVLDDGQEVIRLAIAADRRAAVEARLGQLEAEGEFGGVRLPPPRAGGEAGSEAGGEQKAWLAWIDAEDGGALVLANSLPGLVTGRELRGAYGEQPVFFSVDPRALPSSLPIGTEEIPFARVTGRGDLSAVTIDAQAVDGSDPLAQVPIRAGTLGGMLGAPDMAAGISSRYADHESTVRGITSEVNAQVREVPFLLKGVAEGLAAKLNTALRSWDGRALIAMGPNNHVRIAYGAHDVRKSRVAVIQLLQTVVDNVSIARNFISQLPNLSFRRRVAKGDGQDIELLVIRNAGRTVPAQLRPLIADDGDLNIAMGWSSRVGGGMFVIGPNARQELTRWLDETREAPGGDKTAQQLLAASFAADPAQVRALLDAAQRGESVTAAQLLALNTGGPPWSVVVTEQGAGRYQIQLERGQDPG